MLDHSVAVGLTDRDRVGITGYSQGGFLTAWGITRPNSTFKAAVNGGGVSDWGMLSATSALPDIEVNASRSLGLAGMIRMLTGVAFFPDCSSWWSTVDSWGTRLLTRQPNSRLPKRSHPTPIAAW